MNPTAQTGSPCHPFDLDTAVTPAAEGLYAASVSERWNRLGGGPNGGYLFTICLQALARQAPFTDPLVASAFFLRPASTGAAAVRTELIRTGKRVATSQASLIQDGTERVRVLATFTQQDQAAGRTAVFARPPELPPPGDCLDPLAGHQVEGVTIADRVEYRVPQLPGWWQGKPSGSPVSELWIRFKEPREPDLISLPLMADAAAPAVLELGELGSSTLEMTVHLRARPAPGWLACRATTRFVINGYHEEDFEIWDSCGSLVAQARQLAVLPAPAQAAP